MRAMVRLCVVSVALAAGGCVIDARRADTVVGEPRLIELPVAAGDRVEIRIPAGEVEIIGTDGADLRGELIVKCPDMDSRCARRLGEVRFVSEVEDGRVGVRLSENGSFRYREGNVTATIAVPRSRELSVRMTAGELQISGVDACLSVDMGAGDVEIRQRADAIHSVALDAGMGDAHLTVGGRHIEAPRAWLVGAELDWDQGTGRCDLVVDLQAGEIDVSLEDQAEREPGPKKEIKGPGSFF